MGNSNSSEYIELPEGFQLPRQFSCWHKQSLLHTEIEIGETKDHPLAVAHFATSLRSELHLCAGPTRDAPRLATVRTTSLVGYNAEVIMANGRTEELRALSRLTIAGFSFCCACGPKRVPQRFAWRKADSSQLAAVSSATNRGFMCVRENGGHNQDVVAVWSSPKLSISKAGDFEFVGAGATGELGPEFVIMSICAILKNWHNANTSMLGVTSSSSSAVAIS